MANYLRALAARLRELLGDRRAERELHEEIETHIRLLTERYVRRGMTEDEAARTARRQFGNITLLKEVNREMRGIRLIDTLFQDLRFGVRMLLKHKGFTVVAALTLALGIGATTAIFSVVYAVLLRPLPFKEPAALVMVWERDPKQGYEGNMTTAGTFLDWQEQNESFAEMAGFESTRGFAITGAPEAERVTGAIVSVNLFSMLGVAPMIGRQFTAEEGMTGRNQVVMLSHSLWQRRFGADTQIAGKTITLDGRPYTVVGVMPPGFRFPGATGVLFRFFVNQPAEVWAPKVLDGSARDQRRSHSWQALARLKPGVTVGQATSGMDLVQQRVMAQNKGIFMGTHVKLVPLREQVVANVQLGLLTL